ncbi:MAG: hypothetical protein FWC50_06790 [Planctomycetaceae bacterium]|nr:hypothetical protein [Planctomycetaceae bacterium]
MNQDKLINNVMREIELLDDSAKLQVAEMVLRSLREKTSQQQQKRYFFRDIQGKEPGLWDEEGGIDEFIRKEWES